MRTNQGYIALFTVLIITGVLMIVIMASNIGGFQSNSVILNAFSKEESKTAAHSCLTLARAKRAQNALYSGQEDVVIGQTECRIEAFSGALVTVSAESNSSRTRFRAEVDLDTLEIISIEELNN